MNGINETGKESARLEHCPKCHSTECRNNMYFCKGREIRVYVECAKCGAFVARYTISCYTSDRPFESILRKLRYAKLNSGKRTMKLLRGFEENVSGEFARVLELVRDREDSRRIDEIINEDFSGD